MSGYYLTVLIYYFFKSNRDTTKRVSQTLLNINYSSTEAGAAAIALVTLPERKQRVQA